jgi:uncharacterized protein (DUF1778 family)
MNQHDSDTDTSVRGRITARLSAEKQRVLQLAAELSGSTINQFIVQAALKAAEDVFAQEDAFRTIRLNAEESERFIALLESPPKPNDALKRAMTKFRKQHLGNVHSTT